MNKPKIFRALACALLATSVATAGTLVTPPVVAYAEDTVVTDSMAVNGVIPLNNAGSSYVVNGTLTYPIEITRGCNLTFNSGAKLEVSDSEHDAIHVNTDANVSIVNAKVEHTSASGKALRVDGRATVTLTNCDFKAAGRNCIDVEAGTLTIKSGTYEATSSSASALIRSNGRLTIEDGVFKAPEGVNCITKSGTGTLTITGGGFSSPDVAPYIPQGKVFSKDATSDLWVLGDDSGASDSDNYCVKLNGNVIAYFASKDDANAFAARVADSEVVPVNSCTVSFDVNGGYSESGDTSAYVSQVVAKGDKAAQPSTPYKSDFKFVKWVSGDNDETEAFDFNTAITSNLELRAVYALTTETFKITYDANGGSFSGGAATTDDTFNYGEKSAKNVSDPTYSGKFFVGWTLADGSEFEFGKPMTQNVTLKAKWADPVASCDGKGYATLQEAFDAAKEGSTVTLLTDIELEENDTAYGAVCKNVKNLTFDLGAHEIKFKADPDDRCSVLYFCSCENLVIKNGYIEGEDVDCVFLEDCNNYGLSSLTVEAKGDYGSAIYAGDSAGKITSGFYKGATDDCALYLVDGSLEISGGAFVAQVEERVAPASVELDDTSLTVTGGSFFGPISGDPNSVEISGGDFDSCRNIGSVVEGYTMLKRAGESGLYEVVKADDEGIPADAYWSVTLSLEYGEETHELATIYFESGDDGQEFIDTYKDEYEKRGFTFTLTRLRYKVSFQSLGEVVSTKGVRVGQAVGELPAGEEVAGWTFSGWYLDKEKVDAGYIPGDDVTLVAMWTKDDSGDESDDPDKGGKGDDPDDPDKGDKGDDSGDKGDGGKGGSDKGGSQGKNDAAIPQTGDSTNNVLPVAIAVAGVAVVAAGLVTFARNKRR